MRTNDADDAPPFRASGLVFDGARAFIAVRVPGGSDAFAASLPPRLARFWSQIFIASGRYDVLPIVALSAHAASLCGIPHAQFITENARWMADRDVHGVYRLLLKVLSPSTVAMRLPKASMRYFDFGNATADQISHDTCRSTQAGIPVAMVDWFVAASIGFCDVALRIAGAKSVSVREVSRVDDGVVGAMRTSTLTLEIKWDR